MNTAMLHSQTITLGFCALGCSAIAATAAAQDDQRLVMPLSDASRPATLEIAVFMGDVHVRGYDGDEVIIVADAPMRDADEEEAPRADGLRRIQTSSVGLTVEEANNVVTVRMEYSPRDIDIDVQVPNRTSVRANLVNGDVTVMGVTGEHELTNVNGDVTATDLSGSAVINSTNGDIEATLVAVDAARPMSFTSFNGDITVA